MLLLLAVGLVNLYSASITAGGAVSPYFRSQLQWSLIGFGVLLLMLCFHYRLLLNLAAPAYILSLLLLVLVVLVGKTVGGQKNWLVWGSFRMQPAEFAKLAAVLILARYFHCNPRPEGYGIKDLAVPILILALPMALIFMVKDVGSALFFGLIGLVYLFVVRVKLAWVAIALLIAFGGAAVGYKFFLSNNQRGRVQSFLHPEKDPKGKGYHLIQSKIAVGSGGLSGNGYLKGNLNKFRFLPERHTDFVFPVIAEEWGFLGSGLTLAAFGIFFLLLLQAAGKARDSFGGLLIVGVAAWLFGQFAVNLGGVLGLMPLAGVTLPFLSYGGSALLTTMAGMGMVFNVYMRRYTF